MLLRSLNRSFRRTRDRSSILEDDLDIPTFLRSKRESHTRSTGIPHASDRLERLVMDLEQGTIERSAAKSLWKSLSREIISMKIAGWSASQKAKVYYYLLKLRTFGFRVSRSILKQLSVEPARSDKEAHRWWQKAQQVLGVS